MSRTFRLKKVDKRIVEGYPKKCKSRLVDFTRSNGRIKGDRHKETCSDRSSMMGIVKLMYERL